MRVPNFVHHSQIPKLAIFLSLIPSPGLADRIIGNLPLEGQWVGMSIANHPDGWKYYAAQGFTMGNTPVRVDEVVMNLTLGGWGIPAYPPVADLYSDANGFLGSHVTSLLPVILPCFPCSISPEDYVFRPETPVVLQPGETYWIRASVHDLGFYYWNATLPDEVPVGPWATAMPQQWTFFRGFWETHEGIFGRQINMGYEIRGEPLPEPGNWLLAFVGLLTVLGLRRTKHFSQGAKRIPSFAEHGGPLFMDRMLEPVSDL